nr:DnaJ domain-containing protein [Ktedonobacteraceae bacterium]
MPLPDYYLLLELPATATQSEIKRSYRRLARRYHPDLNPEALDRHIKLLNEAYKVLSDPVTRAAYDEQCRLLREEAAQRRQQERAKPRQQQEETRRRQQLAAKREPKMTWIEGIFGFVRELKKGLRD